MLLAYVPIAQCQTWLDCTVCTDVVPSLQQCTAGLWRLIMVLGRNFGSMWCNRDCSTSTYLSLPLCPLDRNTGVPSSATMSMLRWVAAEATPFKLTRVRLDAVLAIYANLSSSIFAACKVQQTGWRRERYHGGRSHAASGVSVCFIT